MRIYLDEDIASVQLRSELHRAGHDVQVPHDVGLLGNDDPVHLAHAIRNDRELITGNHDDFGKLHDLILAAGGEHPGILIIRKDDDKRRDITPAQVARAIARLQASAPAHQNQLFILNHWR
jgi:predicted nuclease of predicted toxin-antitoxin system